MSNGYNFHPANADIYVLRMPDDALPNGDVRELRRAGSGRRFIEVHLEGIEYAVADRERGNTLFVLDRRTARLLARRISEALEEASNA